MNALRIRPPPNIGQKIIIVHIRDRKEGSPLVGSGLPSYFQT